MSANNGIPEIPGVDVADGLARVQGNATLYKKLLLMLVTKTEAELARYAETAPDEANRMALHDFAHKHKGGAANLSAVRLAQAVTAYDDLVRNPDIPFAQALEALPAYLDACRDFIDNTKKAFGV